MNEIEKAMGLIITKDGHIHPFGKFKYGKAKDLTDENYHDPSFRKDVLTQKWFQDLNVNITDKTIHGQSNAFTEAGLIVILNGCKTLPNDDIYKEFIIFCPKNITEKQAELLENNYDYLNKLNENSFMHIYINDYYLNSLNEMYSSVQKSQIHTI